MFDFEKSIPPIINYKITYNKKMSSVIKTNKNSTFLAKSNILVVHDIYVTDNIGVNSCCFLKNLSSLMKLLSSINTDDIKREVYISSAIENQQFGFSIDFKFLKLLVKYHYFLSFSGISYFEEEMQVERTGDRC
jgi:hypothetical protein